MSSISCHSPSLLFPPQSWLNLLESLRVDPNNYVLFPSENVNYFIGGKEGTSFKENIIWKNLRTMGFFELGLILIPYRVLKDMIIRFPIEPTRFKHMSSINERESLNKTLTIMHSTYYPFIR